MKQQSGHSSSSVIFTIVDDCLKKMNIACGNFMLLLNDAASYILKAAETLKVRYSLLLHVICTVQMRHNCFEHIRTHFKATDNLITSIKATTLKNRERHDIFSPWFVNTSTTNFDTLSNECDKLQQILLREEI